MPLQTTLGDTFYDLEDFVATNLYTIGLTPTDIQINLGETNLPVMQIYTEEQISNGYSEPKTPSSVSMQLPPTKTLSYNALEKISGPYEFDAEIWQRGNSSRLLTKRSYSFETKDPNNPEEDMDVNFFGWGNEEDYALVGCSADITMVRNVIPYKLFRQMNPGKNWAPRIQFVEVILNNENETDPNNPYNRYQGLYALTEKPKRDRIRINVPRLEEDSNGNVWGGFVLQHRRSQFLSSDPTTNFTTARNENYSYRSPNSNKITPLQREYVRDTMDTLEESIFGDDFTNPQTGYKRHIDIENIIDYILLEEVAKDGDSFKSSIFLTMDEDKRLTLSPWDYDGAFGNLPFERFEAISQNPSLNPIFAPIIDQLVETDLSPQGWHFQNKFLADRLMQDPEFVEQFKNRWYEQSETVLNPENIFNIIDTNISELESNGALDRNFEKWNNVIFNPLYMFGFRMLSFDEEVNRLKWFVEERHNWINNNIETLTV